MNQFVAYGTSIVTSLDLGAYLCEGEGVLHTVEICEWPAGKPEPRMVEQFFLGPGLIRDITISTDREFALSVTGQPWLFEVGGVLRLRWIGARGKVTFERLEACTDELLAFWVIHIFLPIYLRLEGVCHLIHACAIDVHGLTILFTGPSHGGKSTLTDHFLRQGHTLVSDDKVATYRDGDFFQAVPSHPNHRPYRRVEDLGFRVARFSVHPRPIEAIYVLRAREPGADVRLTKIHGHEKFTRVLPSHMFSLGIDKEARMQFLGELLRTVPAYQVDVPWDLERLDEVHSAVLRHLEH